MLLLPSLLKNKTLMINYDAKVRLSIKVNLAIGQEKRIVQNFFFDWSPTTLPNVHPLSIFALEK
jgi:hypothetical protein